MSNQDSEVLDDILRNLSWAQHELGAKGLIPLSKHEYEAKAKIESIIRTEKLKLLNEVRERVIGENDRGTITDPDSPSYGEQYESAMADKDDLRAELTKLEAEKQLAEISLYMFEQYRKEFYPPGKHHVAIPQFHHWLQQLLDTEEAEL